MTPTSTSGVAVGDRLRLLSDIYDDGQDHHPAGYIACKGDVVFVKDVGKESLGVAHEGRSGSFSVYPGEWERDDA